MKKKILLTIESCEKLEKELEYLSTTVRVEIAKNIKIAADYGDLRENAEFEAEKDRQNVVEARIRELRDILQNCEIIEHESGSHIIKIGSVVRLYDEELEEEEEYTIVDKIQANPLEFKLSYESPVGKLLLGKSVGERIEVELNNGVIHYKVLEVK